jgi:hypothetical protein
MSGELTSAIKLNVLVEELGSVAARICIPSGVSSLALAFDISDRTTVSFSWTCAVSNTSDFALIKADIIFLLTHELVSCDGDGKRQLTSRPRRLWRNC